MPRRQFKDITTLLADADAFHAGIALLRKECEKYDFDIIVAPESPGS